MSNLTVQDIVSQGQDYVSNYTTGAVDQGNWLRGVNRAIEYLKRYMGLPSDENIFRFYFYEDTMTYNLPPDFNEGLQVVYDNVDANYPGREWNYTPYGNILSRVGLRPGKKYFSWGGINGQMQLFMKGKNLVTGSIIETFDNLINGGFVAQNDAQDLAIDNNIYSEGSGSLSFEINPALGGSGMASIYWPVNLDYTNILQNNGYIELDVWLPDANLTEINLVLITDTLDFYTLSATAFSDGTAFSAGLNQWKTLAFSFTGDAVVGSPNIAQITAQRVDFVLNGSFGASVVPDFRIDNMRTVIPDYMDLIYLSSYKGTDATGATKKIFLDEYTDIPYFGNYVPDMIDAVALRLAVVMAPQILSNAAFRQMYLQESEAVIKIMGKSWPRKRCLTFGRLELKR